MKQLSAFTLLEVLIALAIIAIGLTALMKATSQNIHVTGRIKESSISHWVAMQGVSMIQLNLLPIKLNQEITQVTTMLNESWYWRARLTQTPIAKMQQIEIKVSKNQTGPFTDPLVAFKYAP